MKLAESLLTQERYCIPWLSRQCLGSRHGLYQVDIDLIQTDTTFSFQLIIYYKL